jgi:hypothetical protein
MAEMKENERICCFVEADLNLYWNTSQRASGRRGEVQLPRITAEIKPCLYYMTVYVTGLCVA